MMKPALKDTKLFIPEIPKHWTDRTRAGHRNIWNHDSDDPNKPEISLTPPEQGLYAVRFEDGWYWVCGCEVCHGNTGVYSYIVCHDHDRCVTCGTHREDLTDTPWGRLAGFQCKPCAEKEHADRKAEALAKAREENHSEIDCSYEDSIICPTCASVNEREELHEVGTHRITCDVCDETFNVDIEYEIRYTATKIRESGNAL